MVLSQGQGFGFHITQHISSLLLLEKVQELLGCGKGPYKKKSKTVIRYQIDSLNAIRQNLIPFMSKHQLHSVKSEHFSIFEEVINLVNLKEHQTDKGFLKIVNLAYNMNLEGKRRKLTKEEYLKSALALGQDQGQFRSPLFIGGPKKAEVWGSLLRAGRGSLFTVSFRFL